VFAWAARLREEEGEQHPQGDLHVVRQTGYCAGQHMYRAHRVPTPTPRPLLEGWQVEIN
jgi:hypothetical protein